MIILPNNYPHGALREFEHRFLSRQEHRLRGSSEGDATKENAYRPIELQFPPSRGALAQFNLHRSRSYFQSHILDRLEGIKTTIVLPNKKERDTILGQNNRIVFGLAPLNGRGDSLYDPPAVGIIENPDHNNPDFMWLAEQSIQYLTVRFYKELIEESSKLTREEADAKALFFLRNTD